MKTRIIIAIYFAIGALSLNAQEQGDFDGRPQQAGAKKEQGPRHLKTWQLTDGFTYADTVAIDTMLIGYQVNNPAVAANKFVLHTGNSGAPSTSYVLSGMNYEDDFIFTNTLRLYLPPSEGYNYFNTKVPYTNISYRQGAPKSLSEESIKVLFTQNVNKATNLGFSYHLMSSIGRYMSQRADNEMVQFWGSYDGKRYSAWGNFSLNTTDQYENAGLLNENAILNPVQNDLQESENIPVNFTSAENKIRNLRFLYNHSYKLGHLTAIDSINEGVTKSLGTVFHTLEYDTYKRVYSIDNLPNYYENGIDNAFYRNLYTDTLKTRDTSEYSVLRNTIQLRLNEEANPLLQFGMRAYITNELRVYNSQATPLGYTVTDGVRYPNYRMESTNYTSTAVGGQIFKNTGSNLWWNAGMKVYIQGYKAGDSEITGKLNTLFRVRKDTAGVFATGGIFLTSPGFYTNNYYSNHYRWNHSFNRTKTLKIRGGIRIPTKRFELAAETRLINDHIYFDQAALPQQMSGVLQAIAINLNQHFKLWGFNSINQLWWQATSNAEVMPLPMFSGYSSNFYENVAFKVLRFQIGFDVKYHTRYFAPTYMPATMQFYNQREREIGNYPFVDAFINFHLKRARIGLLMEHINYGYAGNDYFITKDYPNNPRGFKLAVSWNFYD
jgi:hypothetical protein